MYITLSLTPDRNGFQGQVALNTSRINGFREVPFRDIAGNVEKDEAGYVGTYTEVLMKGCSVTVTEPVATILQKISEGKESQV